MRQTVYKLLGFLFLGLAIAGVLLPVIPATPFLLLAAWFFARSSEKWHSWLLASELFGPIIRNWEEQRCISCRNKVIAIALMIGMGGTTIVFGVQDERLKILAGLLMLVGCVTLLWINTCKPAPGSIDADPADV